MASQGGNVSRDGKCANSSTKCANKGVAINGTDARYSTDKSAEAGGMGLGGLRTVQKRGSDDQHACRLHVIRDVRKSVFTLRIRVFTGSIAEHVDANLPFATDYRARSPVQRALQSTCTPESSA
ncbi:hypothetical protein [Paraburkholderia metrosideri]|uniref:hypothetical protein n=1 Tax=Paraburkholderia metrosideri TaxID=580937 RepID=UPI001918D5FF|nr:hypothetical protein [Paraburkholderia metrosideri]